MKKYLYLISILLFFVASTNAANTDFLGERVVVAAKTGGKELYNFGKTAAQHMAEPGRKVPLQILDDVLKTTKGLPDPAGSRALMHYSPMWKNGTQYNLEILYDQATNSIWHFKYTQKALGPLPLIPWFMFEKNDKRRLYQLIDMYLAGIITASVFCDEFYYCYDLELDNTTLSDLESQLFAELGTVAGRFSPYEEDHLGLPHGFYTEAELRQKILETKEKLKVK